MLRFWIDHRLAVVILLDRAADTAYAHYGARFVDLLVSGTLAQLRAAHPGLRVPATARFVLERIFEGTRRTLAAILAAHAGYQLPGLAGFARWVSARR